jgi:dihydropteroate synthase
MFRARVLNFCCAEDAAAVMQRVGCDPAGIAIMAPKAVFRTILVEQISTKAANLLKQTFLAKGAEVAVNRGTADMSSDSSDVLICGTLKHYRLALDQLRQQPWGLPQLAAAVETALNQVEKDISRHYITNGKLWDVTPGRTLVMGILNLTPDSFSDGGRYNDMAAALEHVQTMVDEGVDLIDIGAESTRPYGAVRISAEQEIERLLPILDKVVKMTTVPISIDTYKSSVATAALAHGAHIINDIWGLQHDPAMAPVIAQYKVPVVLMHNRASHESLRDIISEISEFFCHSIQIGLQAGVAEENFILDPGIGFGKTGAQNLEILSRLAEFKSLGYPILLGTSRKRFIGDILNLPPEERDEGTGATVVQGILQGASIVRVHNVKMAKRLAVMTDAMQLGRRKTHG